MRGTVDKYIDKCGRRWVDLSLVFGDEKVNGSWNAFVTHRNVVYQLTSLLLKDVGCS